MEVVGDWIKLISEFKTITESYDKSCFQRRRVLDSRLLALIIMRMIQSRNREGYSTVIRDFWERAKDFIAKLMHHKPVSQSSFSEAREKLDPQIFKDINHALTQRDNKFLWKGHRLLAIDGSKVNLPRQLVDDGFELPVPQAYYPQGLVSCLYDLKSRLPLDFMLDSKRDERACAKKHLEILGPGDVVVYDRGYHCYGLLHFHIHSQIHTIMRMETTTTFNSVKRFAQSRYKDQIVEFVPAEGSLGKIRKSNPDIEITNLKLRLVKYSAGGKEYVLATTLLDKKKYPRWSLMEVYRERWAVEEMYKSLKSVAGVEEFHGKTRIKVEQEIFACFLLLTISRLISNSIKVKKKQSKLQGSSLPRWNQHLGDLSRPKSRYNKQNSKNHIATKWSINTYSRKTLLPENI